MITQKQKDHLQLQAFRGGDLATEIIGKTECLDVFWKSNKLFKILI